MTLGVMGGGCPHPVLNTLLLGLDQPTARVRPTVRSPRQTVGLTLAVVYSIGGEGAA